ncbi:MAG: hypothetical protein LCH70_12355 [Proteobacteria bacterium]|nr:hypothetical protein [Pseudomonadota bacterium]
MTQTLYAEDQAGTRHQVIQRLETPQGDDGGSPGHGAARITYTLADGSPVRRVDNDTFQVIGTGAYISAVRD